MFICKTDVNKEYYRYCIRCVWLRNRSACNIDARICIKNKYLWNLRISNELSSLFYRVFLRARACRRARRAGRTHAGIYSALNRACPRLRFTRAFKTDYCKHLARLTYANSVATNSLNERARALRARWIFGYFKPVRPGRANVRPANFVRYVFAYRARPARQNWKGRKKTEGERERERSRNFASFLRPTGEASESAISGRSASVIYANAPQFATLIIITDSLTDPKLILPRQECPWLFCNSF